MAFALRPGTLPARVRGDAAFFSRLQGPQHHGAPRVPLTLRSATLPMPLTASAEQQHSEKAMEAVPVGALVLVAGASGGVGQLTVERLLEEGYRVRAMVRDLEKAEAIFGKNRPNLEIVVCDLREEEEIPAVMKDVDAVCSCIGTTAFPSTRWKGDNDPKNTDSVGIGNLIKQTPSEIGRFVLISSAGVTRTTQFPFAILNLFNVLTYRKEAEEKVMSSDLPWTILRPSRLTDAPYTSTDLNTLIRGTRGDRTSIRMSSDDDLYGEASRIAVAEAIVQCLHLPSTAHHCYALESIDGDDPPEHDTNKWNELFSSCR